MSYLPPLDTLWLQAAHSSTRQASRSPSPGPSSSTLTRGSHLPSRNPTSERARTLRSLYGYPPLGSCADADQLSDLEESIQVGKDQAVRFGEKYIVQIGRKRTLYEEDLSQEEDECRRGATLTEEEEEERRQDPEASPGRFVGGHTGHAQAEIMRRQHEAEQEAQRAAAVAARSVTERQAAVREEEEEEEAVDLDANVEDLD